VTTIAYKNGILAADTRACAGDNIIGSAKKIARNNNGDLAGAAGLAPYSYAFLKWFTGMESGPPPKATRDDDNFDRGVIFRKAGGIEIYEPDGMFKMTAPYYALGSGRPEALGAMHAGASAFKAIQAAIAHDTNTGGDIDVLSHDNQPEEV
jgi:ATP-dependent HslUV protease subunit HslV